MELQIAGLTKQQQSELAVVNSNAERLKSKESAGHKAFIASLHTHAAAIYLAVEAFAGRMNASSKIADGRANGVNTASKELEALSAYQKKLAQEATALSSAKGLTGEQTEKRVLNIKVQETSLSAEQAGVTHSLRSDEFQMGNQSSLQEVDHGIGSKIIGMYKNAGRNVRRAVRG